MEYVRLGNTGMKVSRLGYGTMTFGDRKWRDWVMEEQDALPFFKKTWDAGITFYDTANAYSWGVCEEIVGKTLKQIAPRDRYVLATKVYNGMSRTPHANQKGLSRKHIMHEIDASLKRLGTDYIDLYITHRWDPETPIEETMEALHDIVKAGKARYLGASNLWTWQLAKANYTARMNGWTPFASVQSQYNLILREEEREMIPFCRDQKIALTPWSPLARGFLAGNRSKDNVTGNKGGETARARGDDIMHRYYYGDTDFAIVERVKQLAERRGLKPMQVALAWMLSKPWITAPIVGASKLPQIDELVKATEIRLDEEEIRFLEELYQSRFAVAH